MTPFGGVSLQAPKAVLHCKNNGFCMISLNFVKKSSIFQCAFVVANVADSYQITLFARRHCFPRGVSRGLSKTAFEQPKIACWASGAPLGSRAPSWRPFLDFSGCISGLGGSLGYFLVAFGVSMAFFSNFLAHQWLSFCKKIRSNVILHAEL